MTKVELLQDLAARYHVKELIGDPVLHSSQPDAGLDVKWYTQHYWDVVNNAATKTKQVFYVVHEEGTEEWAAYHEREPEPRTQPNQFATWLSNALYLDADIISWKIVSLHEPIWHALVACLEDNGAGKLKLIGYLCTRNTKTGALVKQELDLTVDQILSATINKL